MKGWAAAPDACVLEQLEAIPVGQDYVGEQDVNIAPLSELLLGLRDALSRDHLSAMGSQDSGQHLPHQGRVVHDEQSRSLHRTTFGLLCTPPRLGYCAWD